MVTGVVGIPRMAMVTGIVRIPRVAMVTSAGRAIRFPVIAARFGIEYFDAGPFIIGIVRNKKIEIDHPAEPHDPRLQQYKEQGIQPHPDKKAIVLRRYTDQHPPREKCSDGKGERQPIADVSCPIPKTYLQFKRLAALGAFLRHRQRFSQLPGIRLTEHRTPAATRASHRNDTPEKIGFFHAVKLVIWLYSAKAIGRTFIPSGGRSAEGQT